MADTNIRRSARAASMRKKSKKGINLARLKKIKGLKVFSQFMIYFLLICVGFVYLKPIIEMISKSLMSSQDLVDPSITWVPKTLTKDNIASAMETLDIKKSLPTSIWFSALLAVCQTVVASTTGFALSRYKFAGRTFWLGMISLAFILPVPLLMVPILMCLNVF